MFTNNETNPRRRSAIVFKRYIKPIVLRAITVAAAGALTLVWNPANAQWYAGASLGQSKMKDASSQLVGTSFEDTDTAFKVYGGYQFHRNVGVEFGYINFGTFKGSGSIGGTALSDNWKANGINVSAVGTWPLTNEFSLLGKLGLTRWSVDDKFSVGAASGAAKENGIDLSYGFGAQYAFAKQWVGRVEYEMFTNVGKEATTGKSDIDVLSIGAVYKF